MTAPNWVVNDMAVGGGGTSLTSTSASGVAYARQDFDSSGSVTLSGTLNGTQVFLGLVPKPTLPAPGGFGALSHSLYFTGGLLYVFESGGQVTSTPVNDGDTFSLTVNAGAVTYYKNGSLFYTSLVPVSGSLCFAAVNYLGTGVGFTGLSITGLPVVTYPIEVTVAPGDPTAGEDVVATATIDAGVAATLGGVPWDGSPVVVATAAAAALVGPTAPVPSTTWTIRPRPATDWSDDVLSILYSSVQPTSYTLERLPYPNVDNVDWETDDTQGVNPVLVSTLDYSGSTPGVSLATDHGFVLLTTGAWLYRLLPMYVDGSIGRPTLPFLPTDQAAYECVVTGNVGAQWGGASYVVKGKVETVGTLGNQTYLRPLEDAPVAVDGSWTMVCPIDTEIEFTFPSKDKQSRVTAGTTALYGSLLAP